MRKLSLAGMILLLSTIAFFGAKPNTTDREKRNPIEGTWEQVYGGPRPLQQIKIINEDHFVWVTYDLLSKTAVATAGGTYTLEGNTYREQIEFGQFGSPSLQKLVGTEQSFTIRIEGDKLIQSGTLTDGTEIRETMTRAKKQTAE